jgi:hypothetical protein
MAQTALINILVAFETKTIASERSVRKFENRLSSASHQPANQRAAHNNGALEVKSTAHRRPAHIHYSHVCVYFYLAMTSQLTACATTTSSVIKRLRQATDFSSFYRMFPRAHSDVTPPAGGQQSRRINYHVPADLPLRVRISRDATPLPSAQRFHG